MTKNYLLVHVVAEILVLVIVCIYFQRKLVRLTGQVRDLYTIINNQQTMINNHEQMLSQLLGIRPQPLNIPTPPRDNDYPLPVAPSSIGSGKPPSVMPMVESLLGMLGTVASMPVNTPAEDSSPQRSVEVDVDKELIQELKELNEMRKDEGRIEHLENTTNVAPVVTSPPASTE